MEIAMQIANVDFDVCPSLRIMKVSAPERETNFKSDETYMYVSRMFSELISLGFNGIIILNHIKKISKSIFNWAK